MDPMKKIINGKKYDTETATSLRIAHNDKYPNDYGYAMERLYRKKTGEYFLFVEGGGLGFKSPITFGNERLGSRAIIPLKESEAKKWLMVFCTGDEYESIFGEVEE